MDEIVRVGLFCHTGNFDSLQVCWHTTSCAMWASNALLSLHERAVLLATSKVRGIHIRSRVNLHLLPGGLDTAYVTCSLSAAALHR